MACALTPTTVGSFGILPPPPPSSSSSCRWSAFHPSTVSTASPTPTASRVGTRGRHRRLTPLTSSHTDGHNRHGFNSISTASTAAAVAAAGPGSRRHKLMKQQSLVLGSSLSDSAYPGSGEKQDEEEAEEGGGEGGGDQAEAATSSFSAPSDLDEAPQGRGDEETRTSWSPPPLAPAYDDAEAKAGAALRKLSPSELAGMKARLGLDDRLESAEEIMAAAVPVLADKIRARAAAEEEVTRVSTGFANVFFRPRLLRGKRVEVSHIQPLLPLLLLLLLLSIHPPLLRTQFMPCTTITTTTAPPGRPSRCHHGRPPDSRTRKISTRKSYLLHGQPAFPRGASIGGG